MIFEELGRAVHNGDEFERRQAAGLLVSAYRAADSVAYKYGYYDLSGRLIEVMRWAALRADDPALNTVVAYVRTEIFFASTNLAPGLRALENAANALSTPTTTAAMAGLGALHMRAAIVAARLLANPAIAYGHLGETQLIAASVPEGIYNGTAFGPISLKIHEVALAVELGDGARAVEVAGSWVPPAALPAERRSHYFIDLARAQLWLGRREDAFRSLQEARRIAPQHVREHPQVREALATLLRLHLAPAPQLLSYADWVRAI
jgi:hypothetical protein